MALESTTNQALAIVLEELAQEMGCDQLLIQGLQQTLLDALAVEQAKAQKLINGLTKKLVGELEQQQVADANLIDALSVQLLYQIELEQSAHEYELVQLATILGMIPVGGTLQQMTTSNTSNVSASYTGSIVLDASAILPVLVRIAAAVERLAGLVSSPLPAATGITTVPVAPVNFAESEQYVALSEGHITDVEPPV